MPRARFPYVHQEKKLLPCPFCGCRKIQILPQPNGWLSVRCTACATTKKEVTQHLKQIVASWNARRPPEPE